MSTRVPSDDPEGIDQETLQRLRRQYDDAVRKFEELGGELPQERAQEARPMSLPESVPESPRRLATPNQSGISGWVTAALQSVTLVAIVACAFWLGALSTTVSNTSQKLDKLNDGVVGISRDSLSNRLIAIETKLDTMDKRLDIIDKRIEGAAQPQKKPGAATLNRVATLQYSQSSKAAP